MTKTERRRVIGHAEFLRIASKMRLSSLASCQRVRACSRQDTSEAAIIRSQCFVSFDSFLQMP